MTLFAARDKLRNARAISAPNPFAPAWWTGCMHTRDITRDFHWPGDPNDDYQVQIGWDYEPVDGSNEEGRRAIMWCQVAGVRVTHNGCKTYLTADEVRAQNLFNLDFFERCKSEDYDAEGARLDRVV